ncbi:MAG: UDP-N-acetylmuramoyl-tripeptide--D-alanyl-D-alanine ligase [Gammaproteobacteria bacterium]
MKLSELARLVNGKLHGQDTTFTGVSTDTRTLEPHNLFIALQGPNFDGHHFVATAQQQQAAATLVAHPIDDSLPYVEVQDTRAAFGQLATAHRQQFTLPLIALTGSCGKTTIKTLIATILQQQGITLATEGTLNNDIGVPLTLLRLQPQHQYAVIEMGANHHGEIDYITHLAKPTVAMITNAAPVHLEGFGDLPGVAKAKGEIYRGLAADGIAIINADDTYADYWRTLTKDKKILNFGLEKTAEITARDVQLDQEGRARFTLLTPQGSTLVKLQLLGKHQVMNALAAAAATYAVGIPLAAIQQGLEKTPPVGKRLCQYPGRSQITIMDDSYNANPAATRAALAVLAERPGEKIFVLGDMLELGNKAEQFHAEMGQEARKLGIKSLYAYGKLTQLAAQAFGEEGHYFADQQQLIAALQKVIKPGMTILVKGSKAMAMWRVVEALKE